MSLFSIRSSTGPRGEGSNVGNNAMFVAFFVVLAVLLRILFWAYTDRIWEDALITLNPARNFWDGNGLTHHVTEPRIYSFTSGLSVIVLIIGEGFGHAIAFNRALSLIAAGFAIYFAAKILEQFGVGRLGQAACLSYLATDHLQIFFGMSGMETQFATMIGLGVVYAIVFERPILLGIAAGCAALARPEFLLLDAAFLSLALVTWRQRAIKPVLIAAGIYVPWIAFTWIYYGSPIPNTISVKSAAAGHPNQEMIVNYALDYWIQFAPLREFWFVRAYPGPSSFPGLVVSIVALMGVLGLVYCVMRRSVPLLVAAFVVAGFAAYTISFNVNPYFMWYRVPFFALFFLFVAAGVHHLSERAPRASLAVCAIIVTGYAIHLPFTLRLDREVQYEAEFKVRDRVGIDLAKLMGPGDSVLMEPLGYIGLHLRDRQIYDVPGLGSKIAAAAIHVKGWGAIDVLKPSFLALRPGEITNINHDFVGMLNAYEPVDHILGPTGPEVSFGGLVYGSCDNEFFILRRKQSKTL